MNTVCAFCGCDMSSAFSDLCRDCTNNPHAFRCMYDPHYSAGRNFQRMRQGGVAVISDGKLPGDRGGEDFDTNNPYGAENYGMVAI